MSLRQDFAAQVDQRIAALGLWLRDNERLIRSAQWVVVGIYVALLAVPALLPLPDGKARILSNITLFAQFVFWGLWWPFVLASMVLVGRAWCGLLCPEGSLSEAESRHGLGRALPHWLRWKGWPFAAFALTTIYGQLVSVYQYPKPAVLILGGSTFAAIIVGYLYGHSKRVWCRYLCPVNGVFGLLSKLAPLHFYVDQDAWQAWSKPRAAKPSQFNCAPLVVIPTMEGNASCHMCGRCADFRGSVTLARRSPNEEIVHVAGKKPDASETALIIFGLIGLASGAFHWSSSSWLVSAKQAIAGWLIGYGLVRPLEPFLPWWLLTNYPEQNDTLSLLDGALIVGFIITSTLVIGAVICLCIATAVRLAGAWQTARFHHLAQCLIPIAGCGVILGLSSLTVTMLHNEGLTLSFVPVVRASLLLASGAWALWLGYRILGLFSVSQMRRLLALVPLALAITTAGMAWATLFWHFGGR